MEISLLQAFALGIIAFIAGLDMFNGLTHMHRPVVLGPLVGLVLGDLHTGILTGGTLELVWMGLPALKKIHTNKRDLARAMKGHMGFFNTHPFLVTFVIGIILAMERSKQDVNSIQSTKIAVGAPLGGIGDAMFWLTLLPICGGIGASLALQGSILGAVVFIVLFNVVHLGLRFGLAHYAYRMGVAAIPLIKANTKKVGHAASIVGMTVIGALVATYVRLSTTLEITAGDAVVKLQADVIDKLMPAFLPLVYTLTMFWLVRRGWSPLRLIAVTVVLGIVGKFCHFL